MQTYKTNLWLSPDETQVAKKISNSTPLQDGGLLVPHTLRNTKYLIACGLDAPHPMDNPEVWKYPGPFNPRDFQEQTCKFMAWHERAWCLNDMGLGKTASAIWAAEFLKAQGEINRVLILSPISTLQRVWMKELFTLIPTSPAGLIYHEDAKRRGNLLKRDFEYYVMNHDGIKIKTVAEVLNTRDDIDLLILDEATAFKNYSTDRYKKLKALINAKNMRFWPMTGSPTPNGPVDAWAISRLVNPDNTPKYKKDFEEQVMFRVSKFKQIPKEDSHLHVARIMQPAIRFKKTDVTDLPEFLPPIELDVPLTSQQKDVFEKVKAEGIYEIREMMENPEGVDEHKLRGIVAVNAAALRIKLLQICAGNVYDWDRNIMHLTNKARLNAVIEAATQTERKSIVFVPFKASQYKVTDWLNKHKISAALVNGDTPFNKRGAIFDAFQDIQTPHVLVAHPRTAAHGLTLTQGDTVIWYGPTDSLEMYDQGNDRINRMGQESKTLSIAHIGSHKLEWDIYKRLEHKASLQQNVLEWFENLT